MNQIISEGIFDAMQYLNIGALSSFSDNAIRPILPSLVRMSLLSPIDNTKSSMDSRKQILSLLVGIEVVNNIVGFLQVNYHDLEIEIRKDLLARQSVNVCAGNSSIFGLNTGLALGFERADVSGKVRVVLSEVFQIQAQAKELNTVVNSELFEDGVYLDEVIDILCIALAELPTLLNIHELIDALLYTKNGKQIICCIVANFPDCYSDVITNLIINCEEESIDGKQRIPVLLQLTGLNPSQSLPTRSLCAELIKVPSLMLKLCLKFPEDMIAFISGILLGNDQIVRSWLALFFRTSQKKKADALHMIREDLLRQLQQLVNMSTEKSRSVQYTVQGTTFLRLYCAMRGIAGMKYSEEEIAVIMQLVTSRPEPLPSGIRFVSLALCMLIACPSLTSTPTLETKAQEWLQWLIKEDSHLGSNMDDSSLGEMLLLVAIHFHSNQISAVGELICSLLTMKIPIRPNTTNRIKHIFTQELTEQVITAHAIKVPVTLNLNANTLGYLPVHCIHQLLKSRAFLKHKVTINTWIYKQICNCSKPLHPVMTAVIDVFTNSLLVVNSSVKEANEQLHRPFTEDEIIHIFKSEKTHSSSKSGNKSSNINIDITCRLTSQLLILYYLVQYEDTRLSNPTSMISKWRKHKTYSNKLLSELPIKYLLHQAQIYQHEYVGLFHPLLRLLISNFPHLNLVDDWLEIDKSYQTSFPFFQSSDDIKKDKLVEAFNDLEVNPINILKYLKAMLKRSPKKNIKFSIIFLKNITKILNKSTPRLKCI